MNTPLTPGPSPKRGVGRNRRLLFVKESQSWPRGRGHDVALATIIPRTSQALAGLTLSGVFSLAEGERGESPWSKWQRRFTNYFGVEEKWAAALKLILAANLFDAVIVVARHLLPLLTVVQNAERIWYPADEPAWHH